MLGAIMIGGFLSAADWVCWRRDPTGKNEKIKASLPSVKKTGYFGLVILAVLLVFKILWSEKVPLFQSFCGESISVVKINRGVFEEGFGGWWGARILNPLPMIIGMPTLACLIKLKKPILFLVSTIMVVLLVSLSTAKAPTLLFLIALTILIYFHLPPRKWAGLVLASLFLIPCGCAWFWIQFCLRPVVGYTDAAKNQKLVISPDLSDSYRKALDQGVIRQTTLSYLSYRIFLVPVCVAYRWYEFTRLPTLEKEIRKSEAKSPANLIGRWAYFERFPKAYRSDVRAYASIDADAFFRGGLLGVVVAGLLLFICRILFQETCFGANPALLGLRAYGISILAFIPYQGSLQALIFPQGLGFIILAGLIIQFMTERGRSAWLCFLKNAKCLSFGK